MRLRTTVLVTIVVLTAGCLSAGPGVREPSSTASPTVTSGTATPTAVGHQAATNQPDPNKTVQLRNEWNRSVAIHVRVVRNATGETVHDRTYDLAPDTERTVYDVSEADPDGIERFTVIVSARNRTSRVTIETNACYGNVYGEVRPDGTLYLYYAIC